MRQQWKSTPVLLVSKVHFNVVCKYMLYVTFSLSPSKTKHISLHLTCSAEYFLFCEMLLQRPINMQKLGLANILSREETAYMRQMASQRFESIMQVLKSMPRPMLLVFRNINTVRSINITLGAPVDRYFVMAKRLVQLQFTQGSLFAV